MIPRETVEKIFKKYGMKMALPDDPIYSESPSIHFINRPKKSTAGGNTLASKTKDSKETNQESKKSSSDSTSSSSDSVQGRGLIQRHKGGNSNESTS